MNETEFLESIDYLKVIIPALTLAIGWGIGFLTSLFIEKKKNEHAIISKLFERYLNVHDELSDVLSDLASLKVYTTVDDVLLDNSLRKISKYFYMYYDFIPQRVLVELNCLHSCIYAGGGRFYVVNSENRICTLDHNDQEQLDCFIKDVSLTENISRLSNILNGSNQNNKAVIINLQARRVLRTINNHFRFGDIILWGKILKNCLTKKCWRMILPCRIRLISHAIQTATSVIPRGSVVSYPKNHR